MEKDLDKLGTVLAIMLDKLDAQQKRQTRIIWFAMATLAMAFVIVGMTVFYSFRSIDNLASQIEQNRSMIKINQEVLRSGRVTQNSETDPEQSTD